MENKAWDINEKISIEKLKETKKQWSWDDDIDFNNVNSPLEQATETTDKLRGCLPQYLSIYRGIDLSRSKVMKCPNPMHDDKHPSAFLMEDSQAVYCSACERAFNLFDLIGFDYGLTEFTEQKSKALELFPNYETVEAVKTPQKVVNSGETEERLLERQERNILATVEKCSQACLNNPSAVEHYKQRGFTLETIKKYKLGYMEGGLHKFTERAGLSQYNPKLTPSIGRYYEYVLPLFTDDNQEQVSLVSFEINNRELDLPKYVKLKYELQPMLNENYIKNGENTIILTEGYYDALSIEQQGFKAIACFGHSIKRVLALCKKYNYKGLLLIGFDDDSEKEENHGENASESALKTLWENGFRAQRLTPPCNDWNEALISGKLSNLEKMVNDAWEECLVAEQLDREITEHERELERMKESSESPIETESATEATTESSTETTETTETTREKFNSHKMGNTLSSLVEMAQSSKSYSTPFKTVNEMMRGGIKAELYIMGGLSGIGKSTMALQLADSISRQGVTVLYFSLEMAQAMLTAKMLSRYSLQYYWEGECSLSEVQSAFKFFEPQSYTNNRATKHALQELNNSNVYTFCGYKNLESIKKIIDYAEKELGSELAVIVDYLQIIKPPQNSKLNDKQLIDSHLLELKEVVNKKKIPLILLSSFNRENYENKATTRAFKETGGIEFSADNLIALSYTEVEREKKTSTTEIKLKQRKPLEPVLVDFKILKQRLGKLGSVTLEYFPYFDYFRERKEETEGGNVIEY